MSSVKSDQKPVKGALYLTVIIVIIFVFKYTKPNSNQNLYACNMWYQRNTMQNAYEKSTKTDKLP